MDYQRFLDLAARFFKQAKLVLHKRIEHYSDWEGSPDCILIDEARNAYYITNIGLPPEIPKHESLLQSAVNEYAQQHDVGVYTVSLLVSLGKSLNICKTNPPNDPEVDMSRLKQNGALIVAEIAAGEFTDYLQKSGIDFQKVPLKGLFTVYLFKESACETINQVFNEIDAVKSQKEESEAVSLPPGDGQSVQAQKKSADPTVLKPHDPTIKTDSLSHHSNRPMDFVNISNGKMKDLLKGSKQLFYNVLKEIWSFIIFIPAYILLKASRRKIPQSLIYWFSSICALFGIYYILFGKLAAFITGPLKSVALTDLRVTLSGLANLNSAAVFEGTAASESMQGFIQSLTNAAITIMAFDISLFSFINSVYYLQYIMAFAFLFTIFPVCRKFGKRMVCFLMTVYFIYPPALIAGMKGVKLFVLNSAGSTAGVQEFLALTALCSLSAGVLVIALLIPFVVCLFATKACGKDIDVL
ncbi:MAG: PcfB family protein [Deferribacteraceae bacterium]|jgi:hypothetical protein|nr:PcfB family protein [Deferribacteraceae bacterium]